MTVKELMEKLAKFDADAIVCIEAWQDAEVNEVKEYLIDDIPYVYIGDNLENLEFEIKMYKGEK